MKETTSSGIPFRSSFTTGRSSSSSAKHKIGDLPVVKELRKGMPDDVVSFIRRAVESNHWGGEDAYDKERAEFISKAVEKAGCSKLDADEKELRRKYRNQPKILETIEK